MVQTILGKERRWEFSQLPDEAGATQQPQALLNNKPTGLHRGRYRQQDHSFS